MEFPFNEIISFQYRKGGLFWTLLLNFSIIVFNRSILCDYECWPTLWVLDDISKFWINLRAQIFMGGIFLERIKLLQEKAVNGIFFKMWYFFKRHVFKWCLKVSQQFHLFCMKIWSVQNNPFFWIEKILVLSIKIQDFFKVPLIP